MMWQRTSVCVSEYILSGVDEGQVWLDERMNKDECGHQMIGKGRKVQ